MPDLHPLVVESSQLMIWLLGVVGVCALLVIVLELYTGHHK